MKITDLVDLTRDEMLAVTGGKDNLLCWGGGVMTVLGFASMDPMAATAGLFFIYTYC